MIPKSMFVSTRKNNSLIVDHVVSSQYKLLASQMKIINSFLLQYSLGNYQNVVNMFTRDTNNKLAVALKILAQSPLLNPDYEMIRQTANYSLQGLNKVINQHLTLVDTTAKLIDTTETASILYDMTKLQAYIDSLKGASFLFEDINVTVIQPTILPEVIEYINLYGYPPGGVFDTDKMAGILIQLNIGNNSIND
jgi:hypothetical protein